MYSIEVARPQNVLEIAKVHVECWGECYTFLPDGLHAARTVGVRVKQWRERIERPDGSQTLTLRDHGTVVGFSHIAINGDADMAGICAELHACYLLPKYRGTRAGPEIMLRMLKHAEQMGWTSFSVWAWRKNPIRRTYAALGLEKCIERDREICGFRVPEVGYIHRDIPGIKGILQRNITLLKKRDDGMRNPRRLTTHRLRSC